MSHATTTFARHTVAITGPRASDIAKALAAAERILDGRQPVDYPGAGIVIASAINGQQTQGAKA